MITRCSNDDQVRMAHERLQHACTIPLGVRHTAAAIRLRLQCAGVHGAGRARPSLFAIKDPVQAARKNRAWLRPVCSSVTGTQEHGGWRRHGKTVPRASPSVPLSQEHRSTGAGVGTEKTVPRAGPSVLLSQEHRSTRAGGGTVFRTSRAAREPDTI